MSLCQIVDSNDHIIGYKPRNQIDFKSDYYRTAALWLVNQKGQVLIAQRHKDKDKHPNKWGPSVAGTLEEGETYESNMYKEAEEEIGLTGIAFRSTTKMKFETPHKHFVQWFFGSCDWPESNFTLQPSEVQQVAWVDTDTLIQDVQANPSKYVPSMLLAVQLL